MSGVITFENITFFIALGAAAFGVYQHFRKPDEKNALRLSKLEDSFNLVQNFDKTLCQMRDNHIHTIEEMTKGNLEKIEKLSNEITRLATIIEERIPKK